MTTPSDPTHLNAEFGVEVEEERQQLLRRRFLWYTGTISIVTGIAFLFGLLMNWPGKDDNLLTVFTLILSGTSFSLYLGCFFYVCLSRHTRWPLIKICLWLIVVTGLLSLLGGPLAIGQMEKTLKVSRSKQVARQAKVQKLPEVPAAKPPVPAGDPPSTNAEPVPPPKQDEPVEATNPETDPESEEDIQITSPTGAVQAELPESIGLGKTEREMLTTFAAIGAGIGGVFSIFGRHFLACLFLPLTPRECIRPLVPLLVFNAALITIYVARALFSGASAYVILGGLGVIILSPLIGLPGYGIIYWRDSNLRERVVNRMMRGRYVEMHRELVDARRIHESLFPRPITDGAISLTYAYEPMRQIGGDYLFCKHTLGPAGNQRLNIVMLDVTGHGIPAALTVNRLHGELERIFAEQPNSDPGQVLRLLNRYVNLTLASHWVYVTGLCVRADSVANQLEYASGGHPPAFLYSASGEVDELHSTAMILGAVPDSEFDAAMETRRFGPGDRLIAYTDGAFECRDRQGNQLRIAGIRSLISRGPETISDWPAAIIKCVEHFRHGPPPDDTLVVELQHSAIQSAGPRSEPKTEFFKAARSGIYRAIKN